jgi:hypothetical protein
MRLSHRFRDVFMLSKMTKTMVLRSFLMAGAILSVAACQKKDGEAIVLSKEHIAAAEPKPSASASEVTLPPVHEMASDEIAVDGVVMKKRDRGTSRDPRAFQDEQWLVKVRVMGGGRIFNAPVDPRQFDKLKEGDRVRVRYSVGKYTDTVWGAEILTE